MTKRIKYILVTREFSNPVYIAPCSLQSVNVTDRKEEAAQWDERDITAAKLGYHRAVTGFNKLLFEKL